MKTHGLYRDENGKKSRLYHVWEDMKNRCLNKNNRRYPQYGGKGVKLFPLWMDYLPFYNWAMNSGYESNLTIDRIEVDGDYEPSNCRWATQKEQANNRTTNVIIEFNGESLTRQQWSEKLGMKKHVLKNRLKRGWTVERALTTPLL